jgi:hypothetical protein
MQKEIRTALAKKFNETFKSTPSHKTVTVRNMTDVFAQADVYRCERAPRHRVPTSRKETKEWVMLHNNANYLGFAQAPANGTHLPTTHLFIASYYAALDIARGGLDVVKVKKEIWATNSREVIYTWAARRPIGLKKAN